MSPSAAADIERAQFLLRGEPLSTHALGEAQSRLALALERVYALERIAHLAAERENCIDSASPRLERTMRLRAALSELAQE